MTFMGEYEHSIDAKGRTIVPATFRNDLGNTFIITRGVEKCAYIYSKEAFQEKIDAIRNEKRSPSDKRIIMREFVAKARELEPDKQGRVVIPSKLREFAFLTGDLIFAGVVDHIEVWNKDIYENGDSYNNEDINKQFVDAVDNLEW
ncbi:MAG: division/cell wall cluster transcriptional repressor MraZ [Lachnospiraceae bacterium]|jgi:MraZ protein|nr:division/cell wall cluster transcriptional repressor MraZ [Lachnospiraceae bacterium]